MREMGETLKILFFFLWSFHVVMSPFQIVLFLSTDSYQHIA